MAIEEKLITAEQLLQMPAVKHCELICGEIIKMSPTGFEHGRIANRISVRLGVYCRRASSRNSHDRRGRILDKPRSRYGSSP